MPANDAATETPILAQLGKMRSHTESTLLRWGSWLVLLPFGFTLLVEVVAVLRLGVPAGEGRFILASMFDPVYQTFALTLAVIAALMRVFFQFVPYAFQRLAEQQVIDEKEPGSALVCVLTYQRWLYHPARYVFGLSFAAVALYLDYAIIFGEDLRRLLPGHEPAGIGPYANYIWLTNWVSSVGILLALYVGGVFMFKLLATASLIYNAPTFFKFDIQPSHPDKCGGFKTIGDLCLKMAYVIVVMAVFVGFWLFVSGHATLGHELRTLLPPYISDAGFRAPATALLILLAVTGVAVFFWPMLTIHSLMEDARNHLQKSVDAIARRVHELEHGLLADPTKMSVDDRKKTMAEIDSLKELYDRASKAPTWPFERTVAAKFASSQIIPLLSLLGLTGGPINQLIQIVVTIIQGG